MSMKIYRVKHLWLQSYKKKMIFANIFKKKAEKRAK